MPRSGTTRCLRCGRPWHGGVSPTPAKRSLSDTPTRGPGGPGCARFACHLQLLRPREKTQARRRVCCTNYHVVEGAGYSVVGEQRLDWGDKDVFTVPTWTFCEHVNSGDRPAFLFSFSDAPVMKA